MSKIRALYTNEMIKISRRPSVIIVAAVVFIVALAFPFLMLIISGLDYSEMYERDERQYYENSLAETNNELNNTNLKTVNENVTIEVDGKEKVISMTLYTGNDFQSPLARKILYEDMLKNFDFNKFPASFNWLNIISMQSYRHSIEGMIGLDTTPFEERDADWLKEYEKLTTAREFCRKAVLQHDYELLCKGLEACDSVSPLEPSITPDIIRLLAASDPKGELNYTEAAYLLSYIQDKNANQQMLDSGLANEGELPRILTEERKEILRNSNKILEYKFEKRNIYGEKSMYAVMANYYTGTVARYGLIVLLILIAGSSVSQELATGSIKSLIIAPVKRWKIFIAKLFSIITWMFAASVALTLFSILGTGFAFGFENLPPYLYVSGGNVAEMPFFVAKILIDLVQNIPAFFYAFVAFMISCFTKNTGVSVGAAIGLQLFHEVPAILADSNKLLRFLEFTPLANMNLAEKIFPYIKLMIDTESLEFNVFEDYGFHNPLWSMVLYIVVIVFTVLLIAYEEFTKKDIA